MVRDGVRNFTLDAVAEQSGISKGGILYHYPTKEDLAAAMVERSSVWFDNAVANAAKDDPIIRGRFTRAYVRTSLGMTPLTGAGFDSLCSSITTALLSFPERLKPVREQGIRTQRQIEGDGLDPVLATIIRLAALSGTGAATISRAEHGTGDVLMSNAQRLADALGVPLAEMVTVPQEES